MPSSEDIQSHVRIATGLSLAIATICVVLRHIARRLLRQRVFLDDLLIFLALVFEWGIGIAGLFLLQNGLGVHVDKVEPDRFVKYLRVLYAGAPLYALTIVSVKLSLLFLYYRLFPVKYMFNSCLGLGMIVTAWGIATITVGLFICSPVRKMWYPETSGQCLDLERFYYGIQIPNIVTDIAILVLPIKAIFILPISRRGMALLGSVFGLGLLVVVFDTIRLVVMVKLAQSGPDITWNQVATSIWTCVEPAVAISIACLAHLRPIFKWLKEYWKPESCSQSGVVFANVAHESRVRRTASVINANQKDETNEKDMHEHGAASNANSKTSSVSDEESGLVGYPAHTPYHSATSSYSTLSSSGCGAPSFPAIIDLVTTTQPVDSIGMCSTFTPTSPVDGGPGPALHSQEPRANLGCLVTVVHDRKDNIDKEGSTPTGDYHGGAMKPDFYVLSSPSPAEAVVEKPLPPLP